jgi:FtsP/CotA-like multicopper oxidase with cupredoxin domain
MHTNSSRLDRASAALLIAGALGAAPAQAVEYWLQAGATTLAGVPMWGYALCGSGSTQPPSCAGTISVPGPALVVPPGQALIVHLTNTLAQPTSLVIAGQIKQEALLPVWFEPGTPTTTYSGSRPAGNTSARVRSFDKEAAAGGGSATYTWAAIKPGTYLYSSGTHPQVQVQMGLYGALTKDAGVGQVAYNQDATNVVYNSQATLVYSEVDPALHAAVAAGTYGGSGPHSTLEYRPTYFLINGKPYPDPSLAPFITVAPGQALLLRLLNAGLKTHVPTLNGQYWRVVAEDGNPVPWLANPRQQYTAFLPAGKTVDVLVRPANPSTADPLRYAIFDSRHFDATNGAPGGGMLAKFDVAPSVIAPPVFDSFPSTAATVGVGYQYLAHATATAGNPVQYALVTPPVPPAGMTINNGSGLLTWTPASATPSSVAVTVRATDTVAALTSNQSFSIAVSAAPSTLNHAPVAAANSYAAVAHAAGGGAQVVAAPGVLANDSDVDGNALTAVCVSGACTGTSPRIALNANGGFTLTSSTSLTTVSFAYRAQDNGSPVMSSANTSVSVTMVANRAPAAVADNLSAPRCTFRVNNSSTCRTGAGAYQPLSFNLVSNDTDPDTATIDVANQLPLAVARVRQQGSGGNAGSLTSTATASGGTATIAGGSVTYVPPYNFAGTDTFYYRVKDKLGKESGSLGSDTNNLGAGWAGVTITVQ